MAERAKKVEPYAFDARFERAVVFLTCASARFYGRVGHAIEPAAVSGELQKLAVEAAQAVARDLGHGPGSCTLVLQRLQRWRHEGRVTPDQIADVDEVFELAEDEGVPPEESIITELLPVLKRRATADALRGAIDEYARKGDLSTVSEAFNAASRLGNADSSIGVLLGEASFSVIDDLRHLQRLTTGVPELDTVLDGGLERGGLGLVIGGTGDGKSMWLNSVAGASVLLGLHVGYATLELSEALVLARLKANITGVTIDAIMDGTGTELAKTRLRGRNGSMGAIVVKEFTAQATKVEDLRDWKKECEDSVGRKMDVMVLDYADKLHAPGTKSKYDAMEIIYDGVREMAKQDDIWTWTASQAGRKTKDSQKRTDLQHVSDSMHKVRTPDLVVTLTATDDGLITYFVAKHRTGKSRITVGPLPHDFACARMVPGTDGAERVGSGGKVAF